METPNKMNDKSTFKGINLHKLVECITQLKQNEKVKSISCNQFDVDLKGNPIDNSFVVTTTLEKYMYIVEMYHPFTHKVDYKSGFGVMLDKNYCLHIDDNCNIIQ